MGLELEGETRKSDGWWSFMPYFTNITIQDLFSFVPRFYLVGDQVSAAPQYAVDRCMRRIHDYIRILSPVLRSTRIVVTSLLLTSK
jgi:hypothetical protein